MISIRHCIVFICLQPVLCSTAAYAAEDEFSDLPVVLSDDTLEQAPSRAPVAISSIDRDLIEASGARTIPEVLRLIPGIVVGHSVNDFGDKPLLVAAYHGHSDQYSKQMNVLIDGRSIYDPLLGGVNWYNIPIVIDDIERIEVTRGPNASTYGSNSFMAVINIITRHAAEDQGHFARVNAGNHDIFDATYRYGGNNGDLDYRVTVATVNDDGQDRADGANANDDVSSGLIDYRLDYQINTKNQLTYTGSYGRTDQQAEQTLRPETEIKKPQREIQDTNAHQLLRWDSTINKEQSFTVNYFFNYLEEEDAYDTLEIDPTTFDTDDPQLEALLQILDPFQLSIDASYKSQRHNLEFTHFIDPVKELHLVWGLSGQYDKVESDRYFYPGGSNSRNTWRLYGSAVWDINSHNTIDMGVLLEKSDGTETDVSPRIAYLYHFNDSHTVRVGASQAVRTPFLFEQSGQVFDTAELSALGGTFDPPVDFNNYLYIPQNNLKTEKITSVELGYYGKFLQKKLSLSTRIFQDMLDELITDPLLDIPLPIEEDVDGKAFIYSNLHATTVRGIEVEMDYSIGSSTRLFASGALLDISSDDDPYEGKSREYEESAPDKSLSILTMHDFNEKYSGSVGFYYVGDMSWMDANPNIPGIRNTGVYRILDLRLVRNFKFGNERLSTAIVLKNLLDDYSDYDAIQNTPEPVVVQNLVAYIELKLKIQ
jgi:iron complex outermembrane receptor protein